MGGGRSGWQTAILKASEYITSLFRAIPLELFDPPAHLGDFGFYLINNSLESLIVANIFQ
jgi:hypothetical protein